MFTRENDARSPGHGATAVRGVRLGRLKCEGRHKQINTLQTTATAMLDMIR